MISSRDRILTTHVGSLPRSAALSELLVRREAGESYDRAQLDAEMEKAVRHVVAKQRRLASTSATMGSSSVSA
jgi:5-methyltetrahydropteroyltriglutamate--homocysteine methyltransferase